MTRAEGVPGVEVRREHVRDRNPGGALQRPRSASSEPLLDRRGFLRGVAAVAGAALTGCSSSTDVSYLPSHDPSEVTAWVPQGRWAGHQPGRIYLGVASGGDLEQTLEATGPVGLHRTYYSWSGLAREDGRIRDDQRAGRLPWVSFKPPEVSRPWAEVASGGHDDTIRARARMYADLGAPVIVTFHHEPHKHTVDSPGEFAAAWTHVHDVLADETDLRNVASVPVLGDWVFNPRNESADPAAYLPPPVLDRCAFLGVDVYQSNSGLGYAERMGRVLEWLDHQGYAQLMIGVGETGASDGFGSPTASEWWSGCWRWAESHADRLGAVAYFNSLRNNRSGRNWLLTESTPKLEAFRASLSSPTACRLV